jgi:hypothetical protein
MTSDTSPEAARVQTEVYRRLGEGRRFELACELSEFVRALCYERIRKENPTLDDLGARRQLVWELYGIRIGSP